MSSELPGAVYSLCPICREETMHEILNGRMSGNSGILDCTVRCADCSHIHKDKVIVPEERDVKLIVSDGNATRKTTVPLAADDIIAVDDEILIDEYPVRITSIETSERRVDRAITSDILALWAKRYDKVKMGISINRGASTTSVYFWAAPDEEFTVGDMVTLGGEDIAITKIRTGRGTMKYGTAEAREVSRLYGRIVK